MWEKGSKFIITSFIFAYCHIEQTVITCVYLQFKNIALIGEHGIEV